MNDPKNLVAIGRSRYLYDSIKHLVHLGYRFEAVITEEAYDEYDIKAVDFKELASSIGAVFFMQHDLPAETIAGIIKNHDIKLAISANWQYKLSKNFLDLFEYGILNFHLGNLPDYKGNATVNWSIINGESFIYANIHKMAADLDAGDIISRKAIPITHDSYVGDILMEAAGIAPLLYEQAVAAVFEDPTCCEQPGSSRGLRCYPRLPEDSQINWEHDADDIHRLIRASSFPYKGAFSFLNGEKVIIWKASPFEPEDESLVVPGHVVSVQKSIGKIVVACNNSFLQLEEIEYHNRRIAPSELIRSIRTRFKFKQDV